MPKEQRKILLQQEEKYLKDKYEVKFHASSVVHEKEENDINNNMLREENNKMIEYKEHIFKKIINKILNYLHLK